MLWGPAPYALPRLDRCRRPIRRVGRQQLHSHPAAFLTTTLHTDSPRLSEVRLVLLYKPRICHSLGVNQSMSVNRVSVNRRVPCLTVCSRCPGPCMPGAAGHAASIAGLPTQSVQHFGGGSSSRSRLNPTGPVPPLPPPSAGSGSSSEKACSPSCVAAASGSGRSTEAACSRASHGDNGSARRARSNTPSMSWQVRIVRGRKLATCYGQIGAGTHKAGFSGRTGE